MAKHVVFWGAVGALIVGVLLSVGHRSSTQSTAASKPEKVLPKACEVRKADGSLPERECDLVEMCKDLAFHKKKALHYERRGERAKWAEADEQVVLTLARMHEYKTEDVMEVCDGTYGARMPAATVSSDVSAACTSSPMASLSLDQVYAWKVLARTVSDICPNAKVRLGAPIEAQWEGRTYLIEVKSMSDTQDAWMISSIRQK